MLSSVKFVQPIIISIVMLCQGYTHVVADSFDYQSQVNKYLDCQALQHVLANILSEDEQSFQSNDYYVSGLEPRLVADELARVAKIDPQLVQEIYTTYLGEYRVVLAGREDNADYQQFLSSLLSNVKRCLALNELQADIIRDAKLSKITINK